MEHIVTWEEIKKRVSKLDKSKKYYGVPRGGAYISAMINPVLTVDEADIIIDDLIDSGKTKEFNFTTFDAEGTDEMILQTNIPFYSLCEHHIAPFFGVANVAYIPNGKIVGLSKLARTVDFYANRFQNQERITTQIAERINKELNPKGVGVTLKAQHLCMCMRGVKKHDTWTLTSKMIGAFKDDEKCRNEFLNLIKG